MNAITQPVQNDWEPASAVSREFNIAEMSTTAVPLKPSALMLAEGSRAGGVSVETAWRIYLAMIRSVA